jgi:hypothetical protein
VSYVHDNDKGWKKLLEALPELANQSVKIGVQSDAGINAKKGKAVKIVDYAIYNELGTRRIPSRPFVSSTTDEKKNAWYAEMDKAINAALLGRLHPSAIMKRVGLMAQNDIQEKITTLSRPPNAPSTIKLKKSSNPLIDSGLLRRSIRFKVEQ